MTYAISLSHTHLPETRGAATIFNYKQKQKGSSFADGHVPTW
jgi:hypothetical protein